MLTAMVCTWLMRCSTPPLTGGRASPWVDDPSSFAVRCRLTVKKRSPLGMVSHAATRGLRLASHAAFVGSIRPGLKL